MAQFQRFSICRRSIVSAVLVVALALTGCQAKDAEDPTTAPDASDSASVSATPTPSPITPEPKPASSAGPIANISVPKKPALADKNTKDGLKAFTKWWLELFSYGYVTNDWKRFWTVTDTGCKTCTNITDRIEEHYSSGGWMRGGELTLAGHYTKFELNTAGSINSLADVEQAKITYFNSSGRVSGNSPALFSRMFSVIAVYYDDRWIMLDFGSPEGP